MKRIIFYLIAIWSFNLNGQSVEQQLLESYDNYKAKSIQNRRFKQKDIIPLIQEIKQSGTCSVKTVGNSIEGRPIHLVSIGTGKTQVLLWSQMHGDESTATMALMDLFKFFSSSDKFDNFKKQILDSLTLHFIPMLNPDGAERFERRNAIDVDLNRDALRLQCPESQILKAVRDSLDADWGFNLHDQNRYYSAGISNNTASFSFLAPAYNYEKEINETRGNAMQLTGILNQFLQQYIPGKIGKYSDDFEPRAFGDNIQKWGTRTILIEVGGLEYDREKQYLRKLHFLLFCKAFHAIANHSYRTVSLQTYEDIPFNDSNAFNDFLVRNASVPSFNREFILDIAFRHYEHNIGRNAASFYLSSGIQDIGDLSILYGYEEFDASGYEVEFGKLHPKTITTKEDLNPEQIINDLRNGYTIYQSTYVFSKEKLDELPIKVVKIFNANDQQFKLGANPSILFIKEGQVRKLITNGSLFDIDKNKEEMIESLHMLKASH